MNFLAHLSLSGSDEGLIIGNFIADSVKGSAFQSYPEAIQRGILLHRAIDRFTDSHPLVERSKSRLRPVYRKYSGVITDIYYDHFLASDWSSYFTVSLRTFSDGIEELFKRSLHHFPVHSKLFWEYTRRNDIPFAYSRPEMIRKVLTGMSRRARFASGMENAHVELQQDYLLFQQEFSAFYPELQKFAEEWILLNKDDSETPP